MKSIINWFEIPVTDMERAIAFYEPVMGLSPVSYTHLTLPTTSRV